MIKVETFSVNGRDQVINWQVANQRLNSDPSNTNIKYVPFGPSAVLAPQSFQTDDYLYMQGGITREGHVHRDLWRFEFATAKWVKLGVAPNTRYGGAMAVIGDKVYLIGGTMVGGNNRTVSVYNMTTKLWSDWAGFPLPAGYGGLANAIVRNGNIYTVGGHYVAMLEIDPVNETVTDYSNMPKPIKGGTMVLSEANILTVVGGHDSISVINSELHTYDFVNNVWDSIASPIKYGNNLTALSFAGDPRVVLIGGDDNDAVIVYNPTNDSFDTQTRNSINSGGVFWIDGNRIYQFGGRDNLQPKQVSDTQIDWFQINTHGALNGETAGTPVERHNHDVGIGNDEALVAGGIINGIYLDDMWRYDLANDSWIRIPDLPTVRADHAVVPLPNNSVMIFGGNDKPVSSNSDVNNPTWIISLDDYTVSTVNGLPFNPPTSGSAYFNTPTFFYVDGGYLNDTNTVYDLFAVLNLSNMSWTNATVTGESMSDHDMIVENGKVYRYGGVQVKPGSVVITDGLVLGTNESVIVSPIILKDPILFFDDGRLYAAPNYRYDAGSPIKDIRYYSVDLINSEIEEVAYPAELTGRLPFSDKVYEDGAVWAFGGISEPGPYETDVNVFEVSGAADKVYYFDEDILPLSTVEFGLNFQNYEVTNGLLVKIPGTVNGGRIIDPGNFDDTVPLSLPRANTVGVFRNL